jgi:hypothetical protein
MNVIHKFPLKPGESVQAPEGQVRTVAWQRGLLYAWIELDKDSLKEGKKMTLVARPTGMPFGSSENRVFVGTAVSDALVYHVFRIWL